ncbi:MAG TPA: PilZ domain-containing protein [Acidobacteriota bacterium]
MSRHDPRHFLRAPLNAEAQIEGIHGSADLRVTSISISGLFVANLTVIPAGVPLEVIFSLPDSLPPIRARGIIAYVDTGIGCGMNFVELAEADQERIRRYAEQSAGPAGAEPPELPSRSRPLRRRELRAAIELPCRFWVRSADDPGRISRGVDSRTADLSNHGLSLATDEAAIDGLEILSSDERPNSIAVQLELPEPPAIQLLGQARWWSRSSSESGVSRIGLRIIKIKAPDRDRIFKLVSEQVQALTHELPLPSSGAALPLTAMPTPPPEVEVEVEVELRVLARDQGGLSGPMRARTRQLSTQAVSLNVPALSVERCSLLAPGAGAAPHSLMLKFFLPDGEKQALGAVGETIWARRLEDEPEAPMPFLVGIQFKQLRPESRERLHNFLLARSQRSG